MALQGLGGEADRRRGPLRSVAVALGNSALSDEEPLVRGPAAWAPGRIGTEGAMQVLRGGAEVEEDAWVREEISLALSG